MAKIRIADIGLTLFPGFYIMNNDNEVLSFAKYSTMEKKKTLPKKILRKTIGCLIIILTTLCAIEITLRIQQLLGPLYDLNDFEKPLTRLNLLDDTLNHRSAQKNRDKEGIKTYRHSCRNSPGAVKVLFLGDSFMQGRRNNTIPQGAYNYIKKRRGDKECLDFMNAGVSSYSPAIYIIQARRLIKLRKPGFIVVEFDETDLMDDYIRYRQLMVRDETGVLEAVRHSPTEKEWAEGYLKVKAEKLYSLRLVKVIYHETVYMPRINKEFYGIPPSYHALLGPSLCRDSTEAYKKYKKEITFFEQNLRELIETLISGIGAVEKILFSYHPHYLHLFTDKKGRRYNTIVADVISRICAEYNIRFYNSTHDIREHFGDKIKGFYRWPKDKFSHFTRKGLLRYGELIGRQLLPLIFPIGE